MILYQLKCRHDHRFEAWFRDSKAFDKQAKRRDIECPDCGDTSIEKAPMAPSIASGRRAEDAPQTGDEERARDVAKYILKEMRRIREHVEETCDYVGDQFAEEARRIYYGETDPHGIYGETTEEEAVELAEEDIPVQRIPWPVRKNS
jgi:hypothetical protein